LCYMLTMCQGGYHTIILRMALRRCLDHM
jgi:hypothetical protein